jgi:hypothetical protein
MAAASDASRRAVQRQLSPSALLSTRSAGGHETHVFVLDKLYGRAVRGEGAGRVLEGAPALGGEYPLDFYFWALRPPPGDVYPGGAFDSALSNGCRPFAGLVWSNPLLMIAGQQQHLLPPFLRAINYPKDRVQAVTARMVFIMTAYLKTVYVASVRMLKEHTAPLPGRTVPGGAEGRSEREAAGVLLGLRDSTVNGSLVDGLCCLRAGGADEVVVRPPPVLARGAPPCPEVASEVEVRSSSRKRGASRCADCGVFSCRCAVPPGCCPVTRSRTGSLPSARFSRSALFDCSGPV